MALIVDKRQNFHSIYSMHNFKLYLSLIWPIDFLLFSPGNLRLAYIAFRIDIEKTKFKLSFQI